MYSNSWVNPDKKWKQKKKKKKKETNP